MTALPAQAQNTHTVSTAETTTNGGHTIDGDDTFTLASTGSIAIPSTATNFTPAIDITGADNTINVNGAVSNAQRRGSGVRMGAGTGNEFTLSSTGSIAVTGIGIGLELAVGSTGGTYMIAGTITTSENGAAIECLADDANNINTLTISNSVTSTKGRALNVRGFGYKATLTSTGTLSGADNVLWNDGPNNTYILDGAVTATGTNTHAIRHFSGTGGSYTIGGTVTATGTGYAIYHDAGTATYTIKSGATITGTLHADVRATLVAEGGFSLDSLTLSGPWVDANGDPLVPPDPITVSAATTATNGGNTLDSFGALTVASTGSITTTGTDPAVRTASERNTITIEGMGTLSANNGHGIAASGSNHTVTLAEGATLTTTGDSGQGISTSSQDSEFTIAGAITTRNHGINNFVFRGLGHDNTFTVASTGSISVSGSGAHGIRLQFARRNTFNISGSISASGGNAVLVEGDTPSNRFNLMDGASISGRMLAETNTTLDLQFSDDQSYSLDLQGNWRDTQGNNVRHSTARGWLSVVAAAQTETNGGYTLDGSDELTVTSTGSIAIPASADRSTHAIDVTGAGNIITLNGPVSNAANQGSGVNMNDSTGSMFTLSSTGSITTTGTGGYGIFIDAGSNGGTYTIAGPITTASTGIWSFSASNDTLIISSAVTSSGGRSLTMQGADYMVTLTSTGSFSGTQSGVLRNDGADNTYVLDGDVTATGANGHAIWNNADNGSYTIGGTLTATGTGYAIYHDRGADSTYTIKSGATITGTLHTDERATLLSDGFDLDTLTLSGPWVDANGDSFDPPDPITVSTATTATNGGNTLESFGALTVTRTGSITTTGGNHAVQTSDDGNTITINGMGALSTSGNNAHGIRTQGQGHEVTLAAGATVTTAGTGAHGLNVSAQQDEYTIAGAITTTGANADGIYVFFSGGRDTGRKNTFTLASTGSISVSGSGAEGIRLQTAQNNTFNISGSITATGGDAVWVQEETSGHRFNLKDGASISGRMLAETDAILDLQFSDDQNYSLDLEGDWQDAAGEDLRPTTDRGWLIQVADARTGTNGGHTLDGADTLTVTGSIRTTAADTDAIALSGADNRLAIDGTVSATGSGAYAVDNTGADLTVTIKGDAIITGALRTSVAATLLAEGGFDLTTLSLTGPWQDANGGSIIAGQSLYVVDTATTTTNGGNTINGGDSLTLTNTGSITIPSSAGVGTAAINISGGNNFVTLHGTLEVMRSSSSGIIVNSGMGNMLNMSSTGTLTTSGGFGVELAGGSGGTYDIAGTVSGSIGIQLASAASSNTFTISGSVTGTSGGLSIGGGDNSFTLTSAGSISSGNTSVVNNKSGANGNTYILDGTVTGTGGGAHALHHAGGNDATYTIGGTLTSSGNGDAIHHDAGSGVTYIINHGATINGHIHTDVQATLDARYTGTYQLKLEGDWRDPDGNALARHSGLTLLTVVRGNISGRGSFGGYGLNASLDGQGTPGNTHVIASGATLTASAHWLGGSNTLLVVEAGATLVGTAASGRVLGSSGHRNNRYEIDGTVRSTQSGAAGVYFNNGGGHEVVLGSNSVIDVSTANARAIHNEKNDNTYTLGGTITMDAANVRGIHNQAGNSTYTITGTLSARGTNARAIHNQAGNSTYILDGDAQITGLLRTEVDATLDVRLTNTQELAVHGTWKFPDGSRVLATENQHYLTYVGDAQTTKNAGGTLDGGDTLVVGEGGSITTTAANTSAIAPTGGALNRVIIAGTVSATGSGSYAINNQGRTRHTYILRGNARIIGALRTTVNATLLAEDGFDLTSVSREGPWVDANGNLLPAQTNISTATTSAQTLDGGKTLRVTSGGSITTTGGASAVTVSGAQNRVDIQAGGTVSAMGDDARGIHNKSGGSTYIIGGTVSASGDDARAIHNQAGGSTYTISGTLSASGSGSHAIYNQGGSATYTIASGATITGTLRTDTAATLVGDNFDLTALTLVGPWQDADGESIPVTTTISTATTGAQTLNGNDTLEVTGSGSIATTNATAIDASGAGNMVTIASGGTVSATGNNAHAIHNRNGASAYTISGTLSAQDGYAIYNQGGASTYTISGTVSGDDANSIAIASDSSATFTMQAGAKIVGRIRNTGRFPSNGIGTLLSEDGFDLDTLLPQIEGYWTRDGLTTYGFRDVAREGSTQGNYIRGSGNDGLAVVVPAGASWDDVDEETVLSSEGNEDIIILVNGRIFSGRTYAIHTDTGSHDATITINGEVNTSGSAVALRSTSSNNQTITINGEVTSAAAAVENSGGTGNTYIIAAGATVTGRLFTNVAATLDIRYTGSYALLLEGQWQDTGGNDLRGTTERGWLGVVANAQTATNGGRTLDGDDTLVVTSDGSIMTTAADTDAIAISGDDNRAVIDGTVSATGSGAYAVDNTGDNTVVVQGDASITGTLRTTTRATLLAEGGFSLDSLTLDGPWQDANGEPLVEAQTITVSSAETTTNGGHVLNGDDTFTLASTGSIAIPSSADDGTDAIDVTGADNTITVNGPVSNAAANGHGVDMNAAKDNELTLSSTGSINITGTGFGLNLLSGSNDGTYTIAGPITANSTAISGFVSSSNNTFTISSAVKSIDNGRGLQVLGNDYMVTLTSTGSLSGVQSGTLRNGGARNTYTLDGAVTATGTNGHAIWHDGDNGSYTIGGTLTATGTGYAIYHEDGADTTYTIKSGATITGTLHADESATLLAEGGFDLSTLALSGPWLDDNGDLVDPPDPVTISSAATGTNGGNTLDAFGVLTVTSTGSITTTGGDHAVRASSERNTITIEGMGALSTSGSDAYGLHTGGSDHTVMLAEGATVTTTGARAHGIGTNGRDGTHTIAGAITTTGTNARGISIFFSGGSGRDNTFTVTSTGSISTSGTGAHGIHLQFVRGNTFNISGSISASGGDAVLFADESGVNRVNLMDGASIEGRLRALSNSTLDLQFTDSYSYSLDLQGNWRDTQGNNVRHSTARGWLSVVADAQTTTNGGNTLDGSDELTVASAGSITTTGAHAIAATGAGNRITIAGTLNASGTVGSEAARAIDNTGNNRYTIESGATITGTVSTATRATIVGGGGFNVGSLTLAGEWVDASGALLNEPPAEDQGIGDRTATANLPFTLAVPSNAFMDPEGHSLTYTSDHASNSALGWLSFDGATFTGTPMESDMTTAPVTITVTATDSGNPPASGTTTFDLGVTVRPNTGPAFTGTIGNRPALDEDAPLPSFAIASFFSDIDTPFGDSLTYTYTATTVPAGIAASGWLMLDGTSGAFTGTPRSEHVGAYTITVTATDNGAASIDSNSFTLTVSKVNDAPMLGEAAAPDKAVIEAGIDTSGNPVGDASAMGAFTYTDADADDMGFGNGGTIQGRAGGSGSASAWITGTGTTAMDGAAITGDYGTLTLEGDGGWTYALDNGGGATETPRGMRTNALAAAASVADTFTFRIDDGAGESRNRYSSELEIEIAITGSNDPPREDRGIGERTATAEQNFMLAVPSDAFTDPEGDSLTYTSDESLGWLMFDGTTFSGTPMMSDVTTAAVTITVTASDSKGGTAFTTFDLSVTVRPNTGPTFTSTSPIGNRPALDEDSPLPSFAINTFFDDIDIPFGDSLRYTYTATSVPAGLDASAWLTLGETSGAFSGTPLNDHVGTYTITVTATDSGNASINSNSFTLTVRNTNDAPVLGEAATPDDKMVTEAGVDTGGNPVGDTGAMGAFTYQDDDVGDTGFGSGGTIQGRAGDSGGWTTVATGSRALTGEYGTLTLLSGGTWTYALDNGGGATETPRGMRTNALAAGAPVTDTFTFRIDDGAGESSNRYSGELEIDIAITGSNDPPVPNPAHNNGAGIADRAIGEGGTLSYPVADAFTDVDAGDTLTYSSACVDGVGSATVVNCPMWLTRNVSGGTITFGGTAPADGAGSSVVRVTATDSGAATASDDFTLTVSKVNDAPMLGEAASGDKVVIEAGIDTNGNPVGDASAMGAFTYTDADANDMGFGNGGTIQGRSEGGVWTAVATGSRAITGMYGTLTLLSGGTWTYTLDNGGGATETPRGMRTNALAAAAPVTDTFTFRIDDGAGESRNRYSSELEIEIAITGSNDPPREDRGIGERTATAEQNFMLAVPSDAFNDPEGDTLTYTSDHASNSALGWLSFDGTTFSGMPQLTDLTMAAVTITVTASDNKGGTGAITFGLNVTERPNTGPTLTGPIGDRAVDEDAAVGNFNIASHFGDIDIPFGDSLRYTYTSSPDASAWLTLGATSGAFSGTPLNDHVGTYSVTVTATDNGAASIDSNSFTLRVRNTNDAPTRVGTIDKQTVVQDTNWRFVVRAADIFMDVDAGDNFTLSAPVRPAWANFAGGRGTGLGTFTGTPRPAAAGDHNITVRATDSGGLFAEAMFVVTVRPANLPPVVVGAGIPDTSIAEDAALALAVASHFDEPEGDGLGFTHRVTGTEPAGLDDTWITLDRLAGTFGGTPLNAHVGVYTIDVTATDDSAPPAAVTDSFVLTVMNVNDPPRVAEGIDDQVVNADELFTLAVLADAFADDDLGLADRGVEDGLTLGATIPAAAVGWLSFDGATFSGTPPATAMGQTYPITVTATDRGADGVAGTLGNPGDDQSVSLTFSVTVNTPPEVGNVAPLTIALGGGDGGDDGGDGGGGGGAVQPLTGNVLSAARDPDGDTLTVLRYAAGGDINIRPVLAGELLQGRYGTLLIMADGSYTYTPGVGATELAQGVTVMDTFTFEVGDGAAVVSGGVGGAGGASERGHLALERGHPALGIGFGGGAGGASEQGHLALGAAGGAGGFAVAGASGGAAPRLSAPAAQNFPEATTYSRVTATLTITLTGTNDGPVVANPIRAQEATVDEPYEFTVPANTFTDPEDDALTYSSDCVDARGSSTAVTCPAWLTSIISGTTVTFGGTPAVTDVGTVVVRVTATDIGPDEQPDTDDDLSAAAEFTLEVSDRLDEARNRNVELALHGIARSMGWSAVDSIRGRISLGRAERGHLALGGTGGGSFGNSAGRSGADGVLHLALDGTGSLELTKGDRIDLSNVTGLARDELRQRLRARFMVYSVDDPTGRLQGMGAISGHADHAFSGPLSLGGGTLERGHPALGAGIGIGGGGRFGSGSITVDGDDREQLNALAFGANHVDALAFGATLDAQASPESEWLAAVGSCAHGDETSTTTPGDCIASRAVANASNNDFMAAGGAGWLPERVRLWANVNRSDIAFDIDAADLDSTTPTTGNLRFDGDTLTANLGLERAFGSGLLGIAISRSESNMGFTDTTRTRGAGKVSLKQWSVTPYASHETGAARLWGAIGLGRGELDYQDDYRRRSGTDGRILESGGGDTSMRMAATGAEFDIAAISRVDLVGRVEGMSVQLDADADEDGLFGDRDGEAHGVRGEFELGWSHSGASGNYRAYLTSGFRWDGGGAIDEGVAAEYGGGVTIRGGGFSLDASARSQGSGGSKVELDSYSIDLGYDSGGDGRGLTLKLSNTLGGGAALDPFTRRVNYDSFGGTGGGTGGGTSFDASTMNFEAGYGFGTRIGTRLGNFTGTLRPHASAAFKGSTLNRTEFGLRLDTAIGRLELLHGLRLAQSAADDEHSVELRANINF